MPRITRGVLPLHHLKLIHEQLKRLRNALFVARALGRALVLPEALCSCELGFWPNHIEEHCKAGDHSMLRLPYACPIDHWLAPEHVATSAFKTREKTFFDNPRTPSPQLRAATATVRFCASAAAEAYRDGTCGSLAAGGSLAAAAAVAGVAAVAGEVWLPERPSLGALRTALSGSKARVLHLSDASLAFGSFSDDAAGTLATEWHRETQRLVSSWCCTADERFKRTAGAVPYLLPPLEGQSHWVGEPKLFWVAAALRKSFAAAGDAAMADDLRRVTSGMKDGIQRL